MKFTISKAPLAAALARCAAIADAKASMALLANVLLTITPGAIKVFATDLEVGYETAIEIRDPDFADSAFVTCVPAKKLSEMIKAVPTTDIQFDIDCGLHKIIITGGTVSFKLAGIDADGYPQAPVVNGDEIVIPAKSLVDALTPVAYCQSKDATKPNLHGIWLKFEENNDGDVFITTAATDGHRCALHTTPVEGVETEQLEAVTELVKGVVIPSKAVTEILHLSTTTDGDEDGPCSCVITVAENKLVLAVSDKRLSLSLSGAEFPDVTQVIPKNTVGRIDIKRQALIDAITRVRVATDSKEKFRAISFSVAEDGGGIILDASAPAQDMEAQDRVTAEIITAPEPVKLNSEYLLQVLTNMHHGTVEIHFKDPLSPLLIMPSGTDSLQAVIMPMRGA
jgi:DNA polymerase-3 subunit beta